MQAPPAPPIGDSAAVGADAAPEGAPLILHASCVAHCGRGLLILGASGAGKSSLAIRMIALGARLVSDDRTALQASGGQLIARCPAPAIHGLIESRGLGLLRLPALDSIPLALALDLDQTEPDRLPPLRHSRWLGLTLPLVLRPRNDHLAEGLLLWLAGHQTGWAADTDDA